MENVSHIYKTYRTPKATQIWHFRRPPVIFPADEVLSLAQAEEDSPSGLWRSPGTRVGCKPSGVQIPYPPQHQRPDWFSNQGAFALLSLPALSASSALLFVRTDRIIRTVYTFSAHVLPAHRSGFATLP